MVTAYKKGLNLLSAVRIAKLVEPGFYSDGGGLGLRIRAGGSRAWAFRFMIDRKAVTMGLGPYPEVSLAQAREAAAACRAQVGAGIDPKVARDAARAADAPASHTLTFDDCAARFIEAHRASWRNAKHADQWRNTLATYASPKFGDRPVAAIDTDLVMAVLEPIWRTKNETAGRVRGRIENILDWATVKKYRSGDNPARWRGHLEYLLPESSRVVVVKHHEALPYAGIHEFMAALRARTSKSAAALEFTILTAARTGETTGAISEEFDLDAAVWTVPAERMKMRRAHRVPLCARAVEIARERIAAVKEIGPPYLFPGVRGKHLSNMAMLELVRGMPFGDITVHGFRSTFRDWAAECTEYPNEVVEAALAHVVANKTEAAYRRGDMLERRVPLMREWAAYCGRPVNGQ